MIKCEMNECANWNSKTRACKKASIKILPDQGTDFPTCSSWSPRSPHDHREQARAKHLKVSRKSR